MILLFSRRQNYSISSPSRKTGFAFAMAPSEQAFFFPTPPHQQKIKLANIKQHKQRATLDTQRTNVSSNCYAGTSITTCGGHFIKIVNLLIKQYL